MRLLAAVLAAATAVPLALAAPAAAQFYEKVDLGQAAVKELVDSLDGTDPGIGASVANLAGCGDPEVVALFRAMSRSGSPPARVYGVLGAALAGSTGIDPELYAALQGREERAAVIRESNITGIIRKSPAAALLAAGDLPPAAVLSLAAECARRGEPWPVDRVEPLAASDDPVAAGFAALLLRTGVTHGPGIEAPWRAFKDRLSAMDPLERAGVVRGLTEAALLFEVRSAAQELLEASRLEGTPDDVRAAAVGMALRLDPATGVEAWQSTFTGDGSVRSMLRAAMQLLAAAGPGIPASAFDSIRDGNPVLMAIADAGAARCTGADPVPSLLALLDCGHSGAAEWALVRAGELPPERSAPIWRELLAKVSAGAAGEEPPAPVLTGLAREMMRSDPAAVRTLFDKFAAQPASTVAIMMGVHDSRSPRCQEVARERRGTMPRMGESLAVLTLARAGAPLTDADLDVLGRAAAGGGDLDQGRALEAAWFFAKRKGTVGDAVARIAGAAPAASAATEGR